MFPIVRNTDPELPCRTRHLIEFADEAARVVKITVPPKFGLLPAVTSTPQAHLRDDPAITRFRQEIGSIDASPLEYLERWVAANEVFEDDVRLTSVVEWTDGRVSFAISQPQYHGDPASDREIEA